MSAGHARRLAALEARVQARPRRQPQAPEETPEDLAASLAAVTHILHGALGYAGELPDEASLAASFLDAWHGRPTEAPASLQHWHLVERVWAHILAGEAIV